MIPCLSLLCFMAFGPPGIALDGATAPGAATVSVQGFGRDGACAAWTDGCVACTRAAGLSQCSTPGIACTPRAVTCTKASAD